MKTAADLDDPDAFYEALLLAHSGLDDAASAELNARLVLLLANQIGAQQTLADCIRAAQSTA